jgi:hypothetical protein
MMGDDVLERLADVVEGDGDDDVRATTFVRGLVLGALVGAAVAGSAIWQRRHARSATSSAGSGDRADRAAPAEAPAYRRTTTAVRLRPPAAPSHGDAR